MRKRLKPVRDYGSKKKIVEQGAIIKKGKVVLEMGNGIDMPVPRNFLHVMPGTLGCDLGAGLFKKKSDISGKDKL